MGKISSGRTPHRIRLSLLAKGSDQNFDPGSIIQTTAFMMPPQSPVEPDGFDFRRHAWFLKLGAVGYTRKRVRLLQPAAETLDLKLFQYQDEVFPALAKQPTQKDIRVCSSHYDQ